MPMNPEHPPIKSMPQSAVANVPMLSAELFIIPLERGRSIVYAPIRQAAFVANDAVVNALAALQGGKPGPIQGETELVEFLRQLQILDAQPEQPPITKFGGDPEPTAVTLFLTTACNLRCTYCYASAGDTPIKSMPLEVAKRGIDFVMKNASRQNEPYFEIAYHGGGEPSVNWRVMTESMDYAKKRAKEMGMEVRATAATNGVLNDKQISWMCTHLQGVSLSFDGSPRAHDRHRLTVYGTGSSERVMHTMSRFDEANFAYGVRVTVTADQIADLPDSIRYICEQFKPQRIQVEPAYQLGRWENAPTAETEGFIAAFREARTVALELDQDITYSAARVGSLTNHFCGVTQDSFALSPDGNVSACYEVFSEDSQWADKFFYGKPDQDGRGYRFELPVINKLRSETVEDRSYCKGCYAKWTCAGDCYHKSLSVNGDVEFQGSDRCHITRELTRDQILDRIKNSGGLFWHEPTPVGTEKSMKGKELLI